MVEVKECEPQEEGLTKEMPVQDPTSTTCVLTDQVQRKRLAEIPTNEIPPARVSCVHTPNTGCLDEIKSRLVPNRMSAGHFSAWGVEDGEVLYYMQRDGQSVGTVFVPTSYQEVPKCSQRFQNSNNNCVKQKNRYTISPFRAIQTRKKRKHFATWMKSNSKTNPRILLYSHCSKRLVHTPENSLPCDEKNSPNSSAIWTCDTCLISNKSPAVRCRGCEVLKYGVALQRQWIPAADVNKATICKGIQSNEIRTNTEISPNMCWVESDTVATPLITSVTEMSTSLATYSSSHIPDAICSVPQTNSSAGMSSVSTIKHRPIDTERETVLLSAEINPTACLPIGPEEKLSDATLSPAKPTKQDVTSGRWEQRKCVREDEDSLVPGEPVAKKFCRIQDALASITFPRVFGPPPICTRSGSTVLPLFNVPASTRTDMAITAISSTPFLDLPFPFGNSHRTGNNNISSGMFGSSVTFPSVFGQTGSALTNTPINTGVANAGITGNPSSLPFTGPGFQFSGNLVPNCNFGCSTNNTVFQFGANNMNRSNFQESDIFAPVTITGAPRLPNSVQSSSFSHRKIKTVIRKLR